MSYQVIFTIARMNPPTPGHFSLIQKMLEEAIRHDVIKVNIILSSKTDTTKNPLEPEEKKYLLEEYGIPWIKHQMSGRADDIAVNIIMAHEYSKGNDLWPAIRGLLEGRTKNERALFVTGDTQFPFDSTVDILLYDRTKNPISGTLVRALGWLSLPALSSLYQPFGLSQKEIYIMYSAIRDLDPPTEDNLTIAREFMRKRYSLRGICSQR
jgi:hypothetical protein